MFTIGITPKRRAKLLQNGQEVRDVNEDRLREWVELHYSRPFPPQIELDERAATAMCEYLRQFA